MNMLKLNSPPTSAHHLMLRRRMAQLPCLQLAIHRQQNHEDQKTITEVFNETSIPIRHSQHKCKTLPNTHNTAEAIPSMALGRGVKASHLLSTTL